jgi:sulfur-carrier protein adenylyltransferase/sulfurtransferase
MIWYFEDYRRHRQEREALDVLASSADWLVPLGWRIDGELHLIWDVDIVTPAGVFPVSVRYPNHFPHSPPLVLPRGVTERWSGHQYGAGGELCLEYGPDNWHPDLTGAEMVASAHRLLRGERPAPNQVGEVASRHQASTGQKLRGEHSRFLITRALAGFLAQMAEGTLLSANARGFFQEHSFVSVIESISSENGEIWRDVLPAPFAFNYGREIVVCRWPSDARWPSRASLTDFRASAAKHDLHVPNVMNAVVLRGSQIRAYYLDNDDDTVTEISVIPPEPEASRMDDDHQALLQRKVAVIGCGSLGSKIAVMLARAGVGNFFLVDDDLLLPDNLVRHDLDWRDVGTHKADSVASRIQLVIPAAVCKVRRHRLGGQEASGSIESLIESLAECDLLIDATAEPAVFNYLCAAVAVGKKSLLWAEVFGGGFGGLIARHRPGVEPSPASMRSVIENWCAERGQPMARPANRYGGGPKEPLIADDADVTVIAAHAARMAIDVLIPRNPSSFPNSVYLIGLAKAWLFAQPFDTYPIDVGPPEAAAPAEDINPELAAEEVARILRLFQEYSDGTSSTGPADPTPAA